VVAGAVLDWLAERPLLLATDFDGTLADIAPTPNEAVMSEDVAAALAQLAAHPRATIAVVSGRRMEDVRVRTHDVAAYVGGLHGLEVAGPKGGFLHPALKDVEPVLADIRQRAETRLEWCHGVVIEDKQYALTCHVRRVAADQAGRALGQFLDVAQPALDADVLRALPGAQALELLPSVDWHKGKAVEWIRSVVDTGPQSGVGVVYLGDDRTDEDAFATLGRRGISIGVGARPSARLIQHRLDGPAAVGVLLERLHAALPYRAHQAS
jgi:trehalose-phosphatase